MTLGDSIRMLGDVAEILVTVLLAYVVYKIAGLVDTLSRKIKGEKNS